MSFVKNSNKSPYKTLKEKNHSHCGYINIGKLLPNKAYQIYDITATNHQEYGAGQMAHFFDYRKVRNKAQLPGKYLSELKVPDDIQTFLDDIKRNHAPFLVYRRTLSDKSYEIDVLEYSAELNEKFQENMDIPELETSVSSAEVSGSFDPNSSDINKGVLTGNQKNTLDVAKFSDKGVDEEGPVGKKARRM